MRDGASRQQYLKILKVVLEIAISDDYLIAPTFKALCHSS
jgi:hypothetical protein